MRKRLNANHLQIIAFLIIFLLFFFLFVDVVPHPRDLLFFHLRPAHVSIGLFCPTIHFYTVHANVIPVRLLLMLAASIIRNTMRKALHACVGAMYDMRVYM